MRSAPLKLVPITDRTPRPATLRAELLKWLAQEFEAPWEMARVISAISNGELWKHYKDEQSRPFASRHDWIKCDLRGRYSEGRVSRMVTTYNRLARLTAEERKPYQTKPWWNVVEAFEEGATLEQATELLGTSTTQQEIRAKRVARRERAAAGDGGDQVPARAAGESWVPSGLPERLPAALAHLWQRACNLARFSIATETPAVLTIFELIVSDYVNGWQANTDLSRLRHVTSDGEELIWTQDSVEMGVVRCRMCGSWNRDTQDPHHVIPRSRELSCCGVEHDKPIVCLCRRCHNSIKDSFDGDWATWGARWGHGELVKAHGGRFAETCVPGVEQA